jgi:hypothetical protein
MNAEISGIFAPISPRRNPPNTSTIAAELRRPTSMAPCAVVYDSPLAAARSFSSTIIGMSAFFAGTKSRLQISMVKVTA